MSNTRNIITNRWALDGCRFAGGRRVSIKPLNLNPPSGLVSIVTITFNSADTLERAIQSVLGQSYANVEYIIVDGGSADSTVDIIKRHSDRLEYWCSSKDEGIADAFNRGISLCRGNIIGILNSDDWYEPEAISRAATAFSNDPELSVFYGLSRYWDTSKPRFVVDPNHLRLDTEMSISHPACFLSADAYRRVGGFDKSYSCAMDYDLILRCYYGGLKFLKCKSVLVNMSLSGVSDKKWVRTLAESARSKLYYQGALRVYSSFLFQVVKKAVSVFLEKIGLSSLVTWYRQKLAGTKRIYG